MKLLLPLSSMMLASQLLLAMPSFSAEKSSYTLAKVSYPAVSHNAPLTAQVNIIDYANFSALKNSNGDALMLSEAEYLCGHYPTTKVASVLENGHLTHSVWLLENAQAAPKNNSVAVVKTSLASYYFLQQLTSDQGYLVGKPLTMQYYPNNIVALNAVKTGQARYGIIWDKLALKTTGLTFQQKIDGIPNGSVVSALSPMDAIKLQAALLNVPAGAIPNDLASISFAKPTNSLAHIDSLLQSYCGAAGYR